MTNYRGVLKLLGRPFPHCVEAMVAVVDDQDRMSGFGEIFEARTWPDWKRDLLRTIHPNEVDAAEHLLALWQEHSFGVVLFDVSDDVKRREWVPPLDETTSLRRQVGVFRQLLAEAEHARDSGKTYQGTIFGSPGTSLSLERHNQRVSDLRIALEHAEERLRVEERSHEAS